MNEQHGFELLPIQWSWKISELLRNAPILTKLAT